MLRKPPACRSRRFRACCRTMGRCAMRCVSACWARSSNWVIGRTRRRGVCVRTDSATIGLIVSDIFNPFFTEVSRAVEDAAYQQGLRVILCNTDENAEKEAIVSAADGRGSASRVASIRRRTTRRSVSRSRPTTSRGDDRPRRGRQAARMPSCSITATRRRASSSIWWGTATGAIAGLFGNARHYGPRASRWFCARAWPTRFAGTGGIRRTEARRARSSMSARGSRATRVRGPHAIVASNSAVAARRVSRDARAA